jgi:hypothetical protein
MAIQAIRLNVRSIAINLHTPTATCKAVRIAVSGGTEAYVYVDPCRPGSTLNPFASRCPLGMTVASTFVFLVAIGVPLSLGCRCPLPF